jgi:FMN-dependent NADH-azoreductase
MKQILIIESSPRGSESASRSLTRKVRERLEVQYPYAKIIVRDLAENSLPHLDRAVVEGMFALGGDDTESTQSALRLSNLLTDELLSSDLVVIASPMWNFAIPSSLKAWIDHIVRPGRTFRYVGEGVEGLAKEKRAILLLSSGGVFSEGSWKDWDAIEPYLRRILGFIGIQDIQVARAEGMNIPALAIHAIPKGQRAVAALAI